MRQVGLVDEVVESGEECRAAARRILLSLATIPSEVRRAQVVL
jgi:hypothetical protein